MIVNRINAMVCATHYGCNSSHPLDGHLTVCSLQLLPALPESIHLYEAEGFPIMKLSFYRMYSFPVCRD